MHNTNNLNDHKLFRYHLYLLTLFQLKVGFKSALVVFVAVDEVLMTIISWEYHLMKQYG